jgi:hypothetical protein
VVPVGCLMSVMLLLLFSGLALAQLLYGQLEKPYDGTHQGG